MQRFAVALLLPLFLAAPAEAWWSKGSVPPCDSAQVIAKVQERFAYADRHTFHWGLAIRQVTAIYERAPVVDPPRSLIARRYCRGTAWLSDGRQSPVIYLIESKQGFASIGYKVESCLPAF